ncbi:hypothetical protein PVAG01_08007 [Phlyctema vagabunda]|uniref:MACPF domain-containing protein n=1 Tax=Phlyctema vagabunda TaxID=108571 RepID=A0ABR4PE08_9HELO
MYKNHLYFSSQNYMPQASRRCLTQIYILHRKTTSSVTLIIKIDWKYTVMASTEVKFHVKLRIKHVPPKQNGNLGGTKAQDGDVSDYAESRLVRYETLRSYAPDELFPLMDIPIGILDDRIQGSGEFCLSDGTIVDDPAKCTFADYRESDPDAWTPASSINSPDLDENSKDHNTRLTKNGERNKRVDISKSNTLDEDDAKKESSEKPPRTGTSNINNMTRAILTVTITQVRYFSAAKEEYTKFSESLPKKSAVDVPKGKLPSPKSKGQPAKSDPQISVTSGSDTLAGSKPEAKDVDVGETVTPTPEPVMESISSMKVSDWDLVFRGNQILNCFSIDVQNHSLKRAPQSAFALKDSRGNSPNDFSLDEDEAKIPAWSYAPGPARTYIVETNNTLEQSFEQNGVSKKDVNVGMGGAWQKIGVNAKYGYSREQSESSKQITGETRRMALGVREEKITSQENKTIHNIDADVGFKDVFHIEGGFASTEELSTEEKDKGTSNYKGTDWVAQGGNPSLIAHFDAWQASVGDYHYWRAIKSSGIMPIESFIGTLDGYTDIPKLFADIKAYGIYNSSALNLCPEQKHVPLATLGQGLHTRNGKLTTSAFKPLTPGQAVKEIVSLGGVSWKVVSTQEDLVDEIGTSLQTVVNSRANIRVIPKHLYRLRASSSMFSVVMKWSSDTVCNSYPPPSSDLGPIHEQQKANFKTKLDSLQVDGDQGTIDTYRNGLETMYNLLFVQPDQRPNEFKAKLDSLKKTGSTQEITESDEIKKALETEYNTLSTQFAQSETTLSPCKVSQEAIDMLQKGVESFTDAFGQLFIDSVTDVATMTVVWQINCRMESDFEKNRSYVKRFFSQSRTIDEGCLCLSKTLGSDMKDVQAVICTNGHLQTTSAKSVYSFVRNFTLFPESTVTRATVQNYTQADWSLAGLGQKVQDLNNVEGIEERYVLRILRAQCTILLLLTSAYSDGKEKAKETQDLEKLQSKLISKHDELLQGNDTDYILSTIHSGLGKL